MRSLALLVFSLLPLAQLGAQEKPISTVLRIGDLTAPVSHESWFPPVRFWMAAYSDAYPRLWHLGFQGTGWDEEERVEKPAPYRPFMDSRTIFYLLTSTGTTIAERDAFSLKQQKLSFAGSKQMLSRSRARIQDLRNRIGAPISVEIALYREAGATPPGVTWLTSEDGEKRMQEFRRGDRIGLILHEQARIRPGDRVYLGERLSRVYLADYYVEIAEKSKSVDPVRRLLRYGNGVNLIFAARPDGQGLAMHFGISLLSVPDKVDLIKVGTADIESLERMRHADHRIMGALSMPNQAAFVYAPGGSQDPRLRVLVLVYRKVEKPPVETGALVLPHTFLTGNLSFNHAPNLGAEPWLPQTLNEKQPLKILLDSATGTTDAELTMPWMNDRYMILEAKPAVLVRALVSLGKLSVERSRNFLVRLGREAWLDGKWVEKGTPLALPVMANSSTALIQGKGMTYLASYSPEEAGKMRILDPELGFIFEGKVAQVTVIPGDNRLEVHLELAVTHLEELRIIERKGPDKGIIEAPTLNRLVRSLQLELEAKEKRVLGSGLDIEVDGKRAKTRLWIQVEELEGGR